MMTFDSTSVVPDWTDPTSVYKTLDLHRAFDSEYPMPQVRVARKPNRALLVLLLPCLLWGFAVGSYLLYRTALMTVSVAASAHHHIPPQHHPKARKETSR